MTTRARYMPGGLLAISADSWGAEFSVVKAPSEPFELHGDFAVVSIVGPLEQHASPSGNANSFSGCWDSYESIGRRVDAALASPQPALLLRLSSPGGHVAGCFELADEIRAKARALGKRVVAYVDGCAASAAYALACSADTIVVPPSGIVGSIGCMQVAVDATVADRSMGLGFELLVSGARKADGNPHTAMSDSARAAMQASVDDMAETFFAIVAPARRMSVDAVRALQAGVFIGAKAVAVGLADQVMTFAQVVASGVAIARKGEEDDDMTEEEKAKAALKAIAESDDEKAAARARAALAALAEDEGEETEAEGDDPPKDDDEGSKAKAEGDDPPKDDDEAKAKAALASDPILALAATVQDLKARIDKRDERDERAKLLAKRPDFAKEVVAVLGTAPLAVVRQAVKSFPRGTAKGQVNAAIAAIGVAPKEAADAHEQSGATAVTLPPEEHNQLLAMMGIRPAAVPTEPKVLEDGSTVFPLVRPSARALAAANAEKGKA